MSTDELEQMLFEIQDEIEDGREQGAFVKFMTLEAAKVRTCGKQGCNHS